MGYISKTIGTFVTRISPDLNIKLRYFLTHKRLFPAKNPQTFVEKLLWLRMNYYNNSPLVIQCADKVGVRDYVEKNGYGHYLNDIHGIYDSVDDIDWDKLPQRFAMKWNFGASYNIICSDKSALDIEKTKETMKKWGKTEYYLPYAEMQYKYCKKKILVEKYLDTEQGFLPYDYKLYCFNGKCRAILFIADRDNTEEKKGAFFSPAWDYLGLPGYRYKEFDTLPQKPESLEKMIECAEVLSKGIPFVRVDFFEYNKEPIFGEMTFTPASGLKPAQIDLDGKDMGEYIDLSEESLKKVSSKR